MRIVLAALLLCLGMAPSHADPAQDKALVADVATKFLAPGYAALADAAGANRTAWAIYCAAPDGQRLEALRQSHRNLALSFGRVQAFRFGPIGDANTMERLYFWPERKNAAAKGLAALLAGTDPFTPERVARASAAAQGIPALERLAFTTDGAEPDIAGTSDPARRACAAGLAIATSVATITLAVSDAWNAPGTGLAARLGTGEIDPGLAPDLQQAASLMITDFMTTLAVIQDQKVEPILGDSVEAARPAAAEARLSGLTVPMILANLDGLRAFDAALGGAAGSLHMKSWDAMLHRLEDEAAAMQDFPDGVTDPEKRLSQQKFLNRLKAVRAILKDEVPLVLGLKLGFNGLDGD